jgi:protein arginine N-methyltransferase 1
MYSILQFGQMIADEVRMDAYARALRRAVREDSIVLDVGTGTGIFALLACRFGAQRVYAIEPGDTIEVAREVAAANGYSERIQFIQDRVEDVKLPERADVIVSDLRGALPFLGGHLQAIADVRERLLAPGGRLIPLRDEIWAAPVEAPELYAGNTAIWTGNPWQLDMSPARRLAVNSVWSAAGESTRALADARHLATVEYAEVRDPSLRSAATWRIERCGKAHAILLWFDATLADGIHFSTAPGGPDLVYGRACLPLAEPAEVREGERIDLSLRADQVGGDYVWSWDSSVRAGARDGTPRTRFRQSSFLGQPLTPDRLRAHAPDRVAGLNARGHIDRLVLDLMGSGVANEEIARRVAASFPDRFPSREDALDRVGTLCATYGARE